MAVWPSPLNSWRKARPRADNCRPPGSQTPHAWKPSSAFWSWPNPSLNAVANRWRSYPSGTSLLKHRRAFENWHCVFSLNPKNRSQSVFWARGEGARVHVQREGYVVLAPLELREDDFDVAGVDLVQNVGTQGDMVILGGHARSRFRVLKRDFYHDTVALDMGELRFLSARRTRPGTRHTGHSFASRNVDHPVVPRRGEAPPPRARVSDVR